MPALRPGDTIRARGERWRVARVRAYAEVAIIETRGADRANGAATEHFVLPFERIEQVPGVERPRFVRPSTWRRHARSWLANATPAPSSLRAAAGAAIAIVPFQLEPALAVTRGEAGRILIADAVGLGKTIQAGLIVAETVARQPDARALVVCPAGLRLQWQRELAERFGLAAAVVDTAGVARLASGHAHGANPWTLQALSVTSIDYAKRPEVLRALEPLLWDVVIFDEAHGLAGTSERAAAAARIARRARTVVLLSATPHSGDEDAFGRLCALGALPGDPPLMLFRRTRRDAGLVSRRHERLLPVRPTPAEAAMHRALTAYAALVWQDRQAPPGARLALGVLLRRACSSAASLARSVTRRLALLRESAPAATTQPTLPLFSADDDEEPDAVLAIRGLRDEAREHRILSDLAAMGWRAAAAESKIGALLRLLRRAGEPALVFTEYRDTLERLASRLPGHIVLLHGGLTARERAAAAGEFTAGRADVLLATDAASEGLNLHARARLVINVELPWTPLRLEQRIGRLDRMGQRRVVHAVHLVARATAEERVLARLCTRDALARASLESLANAVVAGAPVPEEAAEREVPAGARMGDMTAAAAVEARRLEQARRMRAPGSAPASRPVVSVLRRLGNGRGRIWSFSIEVTDAQEHPLFHAIFGASDGCAPSVHVGSLREFIDRDGGALVSALERRAALQIAVVLDELRHVTTRLRRRERAIEEDLLAERARALALPVQAGLFDRREERRTAAQLRSLEEALDACATRLAQLHAESRPRAGRASLLFLVAPR